MGSTFIASATVAVRRQADKDEHAVSLRRLLEELKSHPPLFSRAYFSSLYSPHHPKVLVEHDYDRVAGHGRNELDTADIQNDIDLLVAETDAIRHYVNKKIAHY